MKNVIIVSSGGARYAFELRWVREVVSLGHVTRVPGAPPHIAGVVNVHGSITPVLDVSAFGVTASEAPGRHDTSSHPHPPRGDGAVLVEVEDMVAAIRMDAVDEVSTVAEKSIDTSGVAGRAGTDPGRPGRRSREDSVVRAGIVSGAVEDSRGRQVWLIDPGRMLELAKNAALEAGTPAIQPSSPGAGHGPG